MNPYRISDAMGRQPMTIDDYLDMGEGEVNRRWDELLQAQHEAMRQMSEASGEQKVMTYCHIITQIETALGNLLIVRMHQRSKKNDS